MKSWFFVASLLTVPALGSWLAGCGDDEEVRNEDPSTPDGGGDDGSAPDAGEDAAATDAGSDADTMPGCPATTGIPQRLLLVAGAANSELASFNLTSKTTDGRLAFTSFGAVAGGAGPYLLEQFNDRVVKLDRNEPSKAVASWNVKSDDRIDGGPDYANPSGVFVPTCTKGYVLRYNRNRIAVIDTTQAADGGAPTSFIDLSDLKSAADTDGAIELVAAVHVASKNRLFVLVGNTDLSKASPDGFSLFCTAAKPLIVAIDTTTDTVVSLGGTGPKGSIELPGYNPPVNGNALAYDPALERLVVLQAGCNADAGGTPGAMQQREVDFVDLKTGQASVALALNDKGFPTPLVYVDQDRAAVGFFGPANFWDPKATTLGAEIPGGLGSFAYAGDNKLVGARDVYQADGGKSIEIVRVPFTAAATVDPQSVEKLGENPFTDNSGFFLSNVAVWPPAP